MSVRRLVADRRSDPEFPRRVVLVDANFKGADLCGVIGLQRD
jgi:hypothetical protein